MMITKTKAISYEAELLIDANHTMKRCARIGKIASAARYDST